MYSIYLLVNSACVVHRLHEICITIKSTISQLLRDNLICQHLNCVAIHRLAGPKKRACNHYAYARKNI